MKLWGEDCVSDHVRRNRLRWFGHVERVCCVLCSSSSTPKSKPCLVKRTAIGRDGVRRRVGRQRGAGRWGQWGGVGGRGESERGRVGSEGGAWGRTCSSATLDSLAVQQSSLTLGIPRPRLRASPSIGMSSLDFYLLKMSFYKLIASETISQADIRVSQTVKLIMHN